MTILEILNELSQSTSRKKKEEILKREFNNKSLKLTFWAAYCQEVVYWIAAHPEVVEYAGTMTLDTAIDEILANLAERKITGHAGIEFYRSTLSALSKPDAVVVRRIIDRDLRCGVQTPTINKVWRELIPTYNVMLAGKDPKHLQFPDVVVQTKYDGVRCIVTHKENGDIEMRTRNGSLITCLELMYNDFRKVIGAR